jgi:hypothetical protein
MKASKILQPKSSARKRLTTRRESVTPILEREEWFFAEVPEDEILTCFYYEYARLRKDIRELIYAWCEKLSDLPKAYDEANTSEARKERGGWWDHTFTDAKTATDAFWRELMQLTDSTCSQLLINLLEFPDVPWQKIRPSRRAKLKGLLTFTRDQYPEILGGLWPETNQNALNAIRYNHMRTSLGELVPFSIDWRGGVEKVIKDFEKWARKHYSELDLPRKKKPRDTHYEWLKQLGIIRLKDELGSWNVVRRSTHDILGYKLYGGDDSDHAVWRRARLAAIKRIKEMFPITFPTSLIH